MSKTQKSKLTHFFKQQFTLPSQCKKDVIDRNFKWIKVALHVTLLFGITMFLLTLCSTSLHFVNSSTKTSIKLFYYAAFTVLSAIFLSISLLLNDKHKKRKYTQEFRNIFIYFSVFFFFLLCLVNISSSDDAKNGIIVWTIFNLIILSILTINPIIFLILIIMETFTLLFFCKVMFIAETADYGIIIILFTIFSTLHWRLTIKDKMQKNELIKANNKSNELLLNILPPKVVDELRVYGHSSPNLFKEASIMFTDMVNFTAISQTMSPEELIGELNDIYMNFDSIITKNDCTHIKTVGDSYVAASGIPKEDPLHATRIVNSALECLDYLINRNLSSKYHWEMRVGISSGPVIAGIVGVQRYLYDVFGDTVNTAFRMQTASLPMYINISESTYKYIKEIYDFEQRPKQDIKGKGYISMFFVHKKSNEVQ